MSPEASRLLRRTAALIAVGFGAVVAGILLPTAVIVTYGVTTRDAAALPHFAASVAEPWALAGAVLATLGLTAYFARRRRRWLRSGLLFGAVAAAFVTAGAVWVGDVDRWTALSWLALPLAGALGARWTRYRDEDRPAELLAAPFPAVATHRRARGPAPPTLAADARRGGGRS